MSGDLEDPPGVVRFISGSLGLLDMVERVDAALKAGMEVWFPLLPDDPRPHFALRAVRGSVQILSGDDRHLATYADVAAAIGEGWSRGGSFKTAEEQP